MRTALFGLLLILTLPALAQIYKYTDDKGNTVYTNQPPEGVEASSVNLPPANTVNIRTPQPPPPLSGDQANGQQNDQQSYRSLAIGGLPDEQALRANNGTFVVNAQLNPSLMSGHQVRFLLDGIPQAPPSKAVALQLNNVERGTHVLAVEVLDGNGQVIQRVEEQFTVQRIHTSSPARP